MVIFSDNSFDNAFYYWDEYVEVGQGLTFAKARNGLRNFTHVY